MTKDFSLLINRKTIDILIGDTTVYSDYRLPYLKGSDLCDLSTRFGLSRTYSWGGGSLSRWEYMRDLLKFLNKQDRVSELLAYLFDFSRFTQLTDLGNVEEIEKAYNGIVDGAIKAINTQLLLSKMELRVINKAFVLVNHGKDVLIKAPIIKVVTYQYIRELPNRIIEDLKNKSYDSVITKSRTLLEEVLIYIYENKTKERYNSNGNLIKIYQEVTKSLNMRQNKEWDKRVNELLGGLHKIVSSIASMRDTNSDAHGVGFNRINIKEREARLVANSAMMLAEYWLSVYEVN